MKNIVRDWLDSVDDEQRWQYLIAFQDFYADLIEEEFGKATRMERIHPRFINSFLT